MIVVPEKLGWLRSIVKVRGSVLSRIWGRLLFTTLVATALTIGLRDHPQLSVTQTPFTLIGLALSIFLGFRNNTSYQRFWEGRILWGRLVNTSRSLSRQLLTLLTPRENTGEGEGAPELRAWQQAMVHRVAAYPHTLRLFLRDERDLAELGRLIPPEEVPGLAASTNPPMRLVQGLGERVSEAWRRGWLDTYHLPVLERSLSDLIDIQGGCERIKNTPIPLSYNLLLHRIAAIYCLTLPLGILKDVGLATPLVVLLVSYAFYGLDAIGDEIEDPFGTEPHDLPLGALSTTIERNVRDLLGETELPPPAQPVGQLLL
ncbi:MAG: bestrophin family protein [Planctomycetota bacterium]